MFACLESIWGLLIDSFSVPTISGVDFRRLRPNHEQPLQACRSSNRFHKLMSGSFIVCFSVGFAHGLR